MLDEPTVADSLAIGAPFGREKNQFAASDCAALLIKHQGARICVPLRIG